MRPLQLDFQRSARTRSKSGLAVVAAALLALALMAGRHHEVRQRIAVWEASVDQAERSRKPHDRALRPASEQAIREQVLEVQDANYALQQLTVPWGTLFKAVESAGGKSIALLSMQPDIKKRTVTISGEAKDFAALLDYIRRLNTRDAFAGVSLHRHTIQQQDPERPIRFSLLAVWKVEGT
jgi:hypothetical protein